MTTTTLPDAVSGAELDLMLRAAVLQASPRQAGRERAERALQTTVRRAGALAATIAAYDLALLLRAT